MWKDNRSGLRALCSTLMLLPALISCGPTDPPTFMGLQKAVDVERFLDSPRKFKGYFLLVRGVLRESDGKYWVDQLDQDIHPDVGEHAQVLLRLPTTSNLEVGEAQSLLDCKNVLVEAAGTIGRIDEYDAYGIAETETVFALDLESYGDERAAICYFVKRVEQR